MLGELDKALSMYNAFEGFDEEDVVGTLTSIQAEVEKLPQRYSDLWDLFKEVKNSYDEEAYELLLAEESMRHDFYERLTEYAKTFAIALSSERFVVATTPDAKMSEYKNRFEKVPEPQGSGQNTVCRIKSTTVTTSRKSRSFWMFIFQANEVVRLNTPVKHFRREDVQ